MGAARGGKRFIFFTSNRDMNNIIKIIKSWEGSVMLIDRVTESLKHEIKKFLNLDLMAFFQETIYLEWKIERMS